MSAIQKTDCIGTECVACGSCENVCPFGAVSVKDGIRAAVDPAKCVGCGTCARNCPAGVITLVPRQREESRSAFKVIPLKKQKHWYDYLWLGELLYLALSLTNILFAWLGLIFFTIPLLMSVFGWGKAYCRRFCGRGQLLQLLGSRLKLSRNRPTPRFFRTSVFRLGFLTFFMTMFGLMLFGTYRVFTGAPLRQAVTLLWTFRLPWQWADVSMVPAWTAQFAYGLFSVMATSSLLGLLVMFLFRSRGWCVFCPMGTMTQEISKLKTTKQHGKSDRI